MVSGHSLTNTRTTLVLDTDVVFCSPPGGFCASGIIATSVGAELSGDLFFACGGLNDWIAYKTTPASGTAPSKSNDANLFPESSL